ncbi:MAG: hypothetical protein WBX25_16820 [Rhodomicrobium sp.]
MPSIYEATGSADPPAVFIRDVIDRVKCEVYDAAESVGAYRNLEWASDWTAKTVLTLTIVNTDGLTPNVALVDPLKSALYVALTPQAQAQLKASNALNAVQQKFTAGFSATLSESATRTETITFTLPFGSLINSKRALARHVQDCDKTTAGIRGGLGLQEWIRSAFSPLPNGELLSNARKQAVPDKKLVSDLQALICFELHRPGCTYSDRQKINLYWRATRALSDPCVDRAFELLYKDLITADLYIEVT